MPFQSFCPPFSKGGRGRGRRPRRSSQRAKFSCGISFLPSFFLCASGVKEKAGSLSLGFVAVGRRCLGELSYLWVIGNFFALPLGREGKTISNAEVFPSLHHPQSLAGACRKGYGHLCPALFRCARRRTSFAASAATSLHPQGALHLAGESLPTPFAASAATSPHASNGILISISVSRRQ